MFSRRISLDRRRSFSLSLCASQIALNQRRRSALPLVFVRLPKEAQSCLAGDMQRVAKLMAVKADYEVMRELAKLESVDQAGQDWDERLVQRKDARQHTASTVLGLQSRFGDKLLII